MGYIERITWSQMIASLAGGIVYLAIVLPQLATRAIGEIEWIAPMLWTIGGAIVASIVVSILWGIVAGMVNRDDASASDQRDREIGWLGDRVGQAFLVLGGVGALALVMLEAERFWIGNVLFAGFMLSALLGGLTRVIAYRRGF
ncbi:hypothetical protein FVA74_00745 [Salinibacterium sp. dk2585]|uniref:hypothetical protein n=1 Tax=unclassified Salinibacterium TaxID=2632331 RepID=UPI0011C25400|nr:MULTISPECIES: hypothetical protein [unclassified Salinibacterium]QEE60253.1 hypothetical protein FVA74_00745 [Salinibacterium sp. dk2585]TXK55325.1 hypothetical protein FVP63_00890 [Salinibacterium sp. dk5596]